MITLSGVGAYSALLGIFGIITSIGFITIPVSDTTKRSWAACILGIVTVFALLTIFGTNSSLRIKIIFI